MTITAHDLATHIANRHDIDFDFALEFVEVNICYTESADAPEIDLDAIPEDYADFIAGAFASAQRAGDFGVRELDDVASAAGASEMAEADARSAMINRDRAIRRALARGARVVDVMAASGVSRARIEQIRKGGQ